MELRCLTTERQLGKPSRRWFNADLEGRILLLVYNSYCAICGTTATPIRSICANSPIGMAFFLIVCGRTVFCSISRCEY